jgi:hypothetical protein
MGTTPKSVAQMIIAGAEAVGAKVTYTNATEQGRFGIVHVEMPDGEIVQIKIELS